MEGRHCDAAVGEPPRVEEHGEPSFTKVGFAELYHHHFLLPLYLLFFCRQAIAAIALSSNECGSGWRFSPTIVSHRGGGCDWHGFPPWWPFPCCHRNPSLIATKVLLPSPPTTGGCDWVSDSFSKKKCIRLNYNEMKFKTTTLGWWLSPLAATGHRVGWQCALPLVIDSFGVLETLMGSKEL
ncbi:unnamed protein product [Lactuca saligna]|uniref:Uncharacterized protein n=1 Tax=Lactuca saligna TaxID=75948 RepID=A0AA36E576_LACSI|nr:unnamed protein product [Lactuca saligna]